MKNIGNKTRDHYNKYPFDFMEDRGQLCLDALQPAPFQLFVGKYLSKGMYAADIGCGTGRVSLYLEKKGISTVPVDQSINSLKQVRSFDENLKCICADNLQLPFKDLFFEVLISDGVIHHTPNAEQSFKENARILREGGYMYLALYRRNRYYYYIYTYIGIPFRWLEKRKWGRFFIYCTIFPFYFAIHLFKSCGRRSIRTVKKVFYDYIITPRATFHRKNEVEEWGSRCGMELLEYFEKELGNCHAFIFMKKETKSKEKSDL